MRLAIIKTMQVVSAFGIYAVIFWYSIGAAPKTDRLAVAIIALISLGIAYSVTVAVFRIAREIGGGIVVIAEFLNRHLLEPQKRRLVELGLEQGLEQGRKEERDNIRAQLRERGYDLDEMLPPPGQGAGE